MNPQHIHLLPDAPRPDREGTAFGGRPSYVITQWAPLAWDRTGTPLFRTKYCLFGETMGDEAAEAAGHMHRLGWCNRSVRCFYNV